MATAALSEQLILGIASMGRLGQNGNSCTPIKIDFGCCIPTVVLDGMATATPNKN
jgi:hypothetical protein